MNTTGLTRVDAASRLFTKLLNVFPANRAYGRATFSQSEMPHDVGKRLDVQLNQHIESEAGSARIFRSSWFDCDAASVQEARTEYLAALAGSAQIPQDEWESELREAIDISLDYLVTPLDAIDRIISAGTDTNPSADSVRTTAQHILDILRGFSAYPHLLSGASAWLEKARHEPFSRTAFLDALTRIDREISAGYSGARWAELIQPLESMLLVANPDLRGYPVPILIDFFNDRGLEPVVSGLRRTDFGIPVLSSGDLAGAIDRWLRGDSHDPAISETEMQRSLFDDPLDESSPAGENVPLWKQFAANPSNRSRSVPGAAGEDQPSVPLWKQFQQIAPVDEATQPQEAGAAEAPDLEASVLGSAIERRRSFIRELFEGDEGAYLEVLRRIRNADSWDVGSDILANEVFRKYAVDIYSEPAVALTNAVEQHFKHVT